MAPSVDPAPFCRARDPSSSDIIKDAIEDRTVVFVPAMLPPQITS
jgi:hypothetical protein